MKCSANKSIQNPVEQVTGKLLLSSDTDHQPCQSYHDLKKTITDVIGYMGRYQMAICLAFILNGFIYGINHNLTAFHVYTPAFFCEVIFECDLVYKHINYSDFFVVDNF